MDGDGQRAHRQAMCPNGDSSTMRTKTNGSQSAYRRMRWKNLGPDVSRLNTACGSTAVTPTPGASQASSASTGCAGAAGTRWAWRAIPHLSPRHLRWWAAKGRRLVPDTKTSPAAALQGRILPLPERANDYDLGVQQKDSPAIDRWDSTPI